MMLKACLNGVRTRSDHRAVPVTPAELAADVVAARAAGCEAVHLHVKDDLGADTFDGGRLLEVLTAVREAAAGVPVGVTTGAWALPDPLQRVAAIRSWPVAPDFASVNWHEEGAEEVAAVLIERGIGVEAGLWHEEAVAAWLTSPVRAQCLRVLLELPDGLDAAVTVATADRLLAMVHGALEESVPVLLHGEGSSCWPAVRHAAALGLSTRVGLEDTLEMPDGSPAPGNADLVSAAKTILTHGMG